MTLNDEIGARLQKARELRELSREQAAERLGLSVSAVQAHENGRNALKPDMAVSYCKLYKVNLGWLFEGRGNPDDAAEVVDIWTRIPTRAQRDAWLMMGKAISKDEK